MKTDTSTSLVQTCGKICARVRHRGAQINVAVEAVFSFRILPLSSQDPIEICSRNVGHRRSIAAKHA